MIAYISGRLLDRGESSVVVDTGGVGYEVFIPAGSPAFLLTPGDSVILHTVQIVKEDELSLYGFDDRTQVAVFKLLITVSGIGAKAAMAILSALPVTEVVRAILFEDAALLTRANGVGKKSAERVVLELKDKVEGLHITGAGGDADRVVDTAAGEKLSPAGIDAEILALLVTLGYSRGESAAAMALVSEEYDSVEDGVRLALKGIRG